MNKEKGISKLVLLVLMILLILAVVVWARYFGDSLTTVMTGGIERAEPSINKARQASDTLEKLNRTTEEAAKKLNDETGQ